MIHRSRFAPAMARVAFVLSAFVVSACATTPSTGARGGAGSSGPGSETVSSAARGAGTTDDNIRAGGMTNTRGGAAADVVVPADKATGTAARGQASYCVVHFDNRSDLIIRTFVDGRYVGAMRGWGDVSAYAIPGATRLYARADYSDGSYDSWGPVVVDCPAGSTYTWRLRHTSR